MGNDRTPTCPQTSSSNPRKRVLGREFSIREVTVDDAETLVDIEFCAFGDYPTNQVLSYRNARDPAHRTRAINVYSNALRPSSDRPSGARFLKAVNEKREIVAFAKFCFQQFTPEQLRSGPEVEFIQEPRMNRDWFALNERLRREYFGLRKHCYYALLATRPEYHASGAGHMLITAVLRLADALGLELWAEAVNKFTRVYERYGLAIVRPFSFDPALYGRPDLEVEHQTVMVRGALAADGQRIPPKTWEEAAAETRMELDRVVGGKPRLGVAKAQL